MNVDGKNETIRGWYDRTTRNARRALIIATAIALVAAALVWIFASFAFIARAQTFNGALVIPVAGAIWVGAFVYIFLIPNREVGFRSQESIEKTVALLDSAINEKVGPAVAVWERIGKQVEKELPAFLQEARETFAAAKTAIVKLEQAIQKNEKIAEEARPVVEALRRIEHRIEQEHMIDEIRDAARAVKSFAGTPRPGEEPSIEKALAVLSGRDGRRP